MFPQSLTIKYIVFTMQTYKKLKKTLDVFITNYPHLWKSPASFKGLVRSDHMTIVVNPQFQAKPERKYVCFRDVREHRKIKMEKKLAEYDWSTIASVQDMDTAACKLSDSILSLVNECFPPKKSEYLHVTLHSCHQWLNIYVI